MTNPRIKYEMSHRRSRIAPLAGKPIIVHLVVNVEAWLFTEPMPRKLITTPHGQEVQPDVPNWSWAEYGMRAGLPRIIRSITDRKLPASCDLNAMVIDAYPEAASALLETGWELVGHGYRQRALHAEVDEGEAIGASLRRLEEFSGRRPRGWLGPGLQETDHTPDLLRKHGIEYTLDWSLDDLPVWITTDYGELLAVPYTLEINDSVLWAMNRYGSDEMYRRLVDTVAVFEHETVTNPRILTIALHPHLIGPPHRAIYLDRMLDLLTTRTDVVFATGSGITDWYASECPPV
jgi:peptidoglycan/xylan/chitin deacetylase (PgdA/CDA1 family)